VAVTITIDGSEQQLTEAAAIRLVRKLRSYADGDEKAAEALATAIERRLTDPTRGPIVVSEPSDLDALHRVLNAIVDEPGPAMQLFNAVDMARRAG